MIHSPSLKQIEGKYFIEHFPTKKPEQYHNEPNTIFDEKLRQWQQSVILTPVHESQIEAFENLAMCQPEYAFTNAIWADILQQGIPIPSDNIEIKEVSDKGIKDGVLQFTKYAFLKTEQKLHDYSKQESQLAKAKLNIPEPTKEESPDTILFNECLEAITKLRPNNAGLGVLQHKLKVRLNKF